MKKVSKDIMIGGAGLMLGATVISKVSPLVPSQAAGISKVAYGGLGIASLAIPIGAAKGVMKSTEMLYKTTKKKK